METKILIATLVMSVIAESCQGSPMGTSLTYQGFLTDTKGKPEDGSFDFKVVLYDEPNTGDANQVGGPCDVNDVNVVGGYFKVVLNFGGAAFDGDARWLSIAVRPGDSNDPCDFDVLSPAQEVTPTPYSLQTRGIFVDPNGNIGMGIDRPEEKLTVGGMVRSLSGGFKFPDGSVQATACGGAQYELSFTDGHWPYGKLSGGEMNQVYECPPGYVMTGLQRQCNGDCQYGGHHNFRIRCTRIDCVRSQAALRTGGTLGTSVFQEGLRISDVFKLEPRSSAPPNPSEGEMYMDSTVHTLMVYDGENWRPCW